MGYPPNDGMSTKTQTGLTEEPELGNVRHSRSRSAMLRKRIGGLFLLVLSTLMLAISVYYRSTYLGSTDWGWFWVGESIVGVLLVFVIVQVLRKKRTL